MFKQKKRLGVSLLGIVFGLGLVVVWPQLGFAEEATTTTPVVVAGGAGSLIKFKNAIYPYSQQAVFVVGQAAADGRKLVHVFPHSVVLRSWGYENSDGSTDFSKVVELSYDSSKYQLGKPVKPRPGFMFKAVGANIGRLQGSAVVVVDANGKIRPIVSETVYAKLYNDHSFRFLAKVPASLLNNFPLDIGSDIDHNSFYPTGTLLRSDQGVFIVNDDRSLSQLLPNALAANRLSLNSTMIPVVNVRPEVIASATKGDVISGAKDSLKLPRADLGGRGVSNEDLNKGWVLTLPTSEVSPSLPVADASPQLMPVTELVSPADLPLRRLLLVIDKKFYLDGMRSKLNVWRQDLRAEGIVVDTLKVSDDVSPLSVRKKIQEKYLAYPEKLKYLVLVGDVPVISYARKSGSATYEQEVSDLYYQDLDTSYQLFDYQRQFKLVGGYYRLASQLPEIISARILPPARLSTVNRVKYLEAYFDRLHKYRSGGVQFDRDFLYLSGLSETQGLSQSMRRNFRRYNKLYPEAVNVKYPVTVDTKGADIITKLKEELVKKHEMVWLNFGGQLAADHTVITTDKLADSSGTLKSTDLAALKSKVGFYLLDAPYVNDYQQDSYAAGELLFAEGSQVLAVNGSANGNSLTTGATSDHKLTQSKTLFRLLNNGGSLGYAQRVYQGTFFGDPTLRLRPYRKFEAASLEVPKVIDLGVVSGTSQQLTKKTVLKSVSEEQGLTYFSLLPQVAHGWLAQSKPSKLSNSEFKLRLAGCLGGTSLDSYQKLSQNVVLGKSCDLYPEFIWQDAALRGDLAEVGYQFITNNPVQPLFEFAVIASRGVNSGQYSSIKYDKLFLIKQQLYPNLEFLPTTDNSSTGATGTSAVEGSASTETGEAVVSEPITDSPAGTTNPDLEAWLKLLEAWKNGLIEELSQVSQE